MLLVLYLFVMLCAFVIQTHPVFRTVGAGWHLDLALLVAVAFGLFQGGQRALLFGFITGLVHDALSSEVLGLSALSKSLTLFVVLTLSHKVQPHSIVVQGLFAGLAIGLDTLTRLMTLAVLQSQTFPLPMVLQRAIPHVLLGMVMMPVLCTGLRALAQTLRLGPEKGRGNAAV